MNYEMHTISAARLNLDIAIDPLYLEHETARAWLNTVSTAPILERAMVDSVPSPLTALAIFEVDMKKRIGGSMQDPNHVKNACVARALCAMPACCFGKMGCHGGGYQSPSCPPGRSLALQSQPPTTHPLLSHLSVSAVGGAAGVMLVGSYLWFEGDAVSTATNVVVQSTTYYDAIGDPYYHGYYYQDGPCVARLNGVCVVGYVGAGAPSVQSSVNLHLLYPPFSPFLPRVSAVDPCCWCCYWCCVADTHHHHHHHGYRGEHHHTQNNHCCDSNNGSTFGWLVAFWFAQSLGDGCGLISPGLSLTVTLPSPFSLEDGDCGDCGNCNCDCDCDGGCCDCGDCCAGV